MSEWLIGITAAAILAAVARCLMPPGAVQQVGGLVCAMVMLWAVLKPVPFLAASLTGKVGPVEQNERVEAELRSGTEQLLKSFIERECEAYIVDKAAQLGADCTVRVTCSMSQDGTWEAGRVRVDGTLTGQQRTELERLITAEFGLERHKLEFTGGG